MKMPQRPRNHQLETESVRALQAIIPSTWVLRLFDSDYGVDGEIEIFSNDGHATGKKLLVQLKATDNEEPKTPLKVRLKRATVNYLSSFESPALIVLYISTEESLYFRWLHSFDPYWESDSDKSRTLKFASEHLWTSDKNVVVERDLAEFLELKSGGCAFPKTVPIFVTHDSPIANSAAHFFADLVHEGEPHQHLVRFTLNEETDNKPPSHIVFDAEKLHLVLANRTAACLHFKERMPVENNECLLSDLFIMVGLGFQAWGYPVQAAQLIYGSLLSSSVQYVPEIVASITDILIGARKLDELLDVVEGLYGDPDHVGSTAQIALSRVLRFYSNVSSRELAALSASLHRISLSLQERKAYGVAATIEYNHANILRKEKSQRRNAVRHYFRARQLYPAYAKKDYWLSELGRCLFGLRHYRFSSRLYKASLEIEFSVEVQGLYADALLYSGKVAQARAEFKSYLDNEAEGKLVAEWHLKWVCTKWIIDVLGVRKQSPTYEEAETGQLESADNDEVLRFLAERNIVEGEAWFRVGRRFMEAERYADSIICFVMAAFCGHEEMSSWVNSYVCAVADNNRAAEALVFKCAVDTMGRDFILCLSELSGQTEENQTRFQLAMVDAMETLTERPDRKSSFELRLHFEDGTDLRKRDDN
ncbi:MULTISPECIES: DUF4365 domain-containing protein [unclassified Thioalkalivibrio]|uniref:DUF4365 domain-containing protein n=1 Tax=unclassified Thioalkalivibrio TaxID=2621013 RepID=UPI0018CB7909|nr:MULTISPECIES: DUF4365 domain-containing protein [unclassified Thioalkalivibrio]